MNWEKLSNPVKATLKNPEISLFSAALRDLVPPFIQFKNLEKHPWRNVTFSNFTKSNTPPLVFFTFFKLYTWY